MPKKTLTRPEEETETRSTSTSLIRIEERIEDYLTTMLPSVSGAKLEVKPLFTAKNGSQFFRCNYWTYFDNGLVRCRRTKESRFVRVERQGVEKMITDLTLCR